MDRLEHAIGYSRSLIERRLSAKTQYVYVLGCDGFVKIGIAADIPRRLASLQGGSPHRIEFLGMFPTLRPADEERWLHQEFKEFRKKGEWFQLNEYRLAKLLRRACYSWEF